MIDVWDDLVAAALVGTDRRPPDLTVDGALGAEVARLGPPADPLDVAAVVWAYREAGRLPPRAATAAPAPAGDDLRHLPTPGAVSALKAILEHPVYHALLGEWLGLAAGTGLRLPPELIPVVFDAVAVELRPVASALAGPLGAWLAARNPDWQWAIPADDGQGDGDELEAAASQRNPEWARALLAVGMTPKLLAVLPTAEADAVIIDWLASRGLASTLPLLTGLPAKAATSAAVSRAVIAALAAMVESSDLSEAMAVRAEIDRLARSLDVSVAEEAAGTLTSALEAIPAGKGQSNRVFWERPIGALLATLNFRRSLRAELA